MKQCPICRSEQKLCFNSVILNKHNVGYYKCMDCGFLQTEEPFWLKEAYRLPINIYDTGILQRNLSFSEFIEIIVLSELNRFGTFVDYAGGYGLFTRLMRDKGFDFLWYDPYTENLFARGFEYKKEKHSKIELVTAFDVLEHFVHPIEEIEKMFRISENIIFSTELLPEPVPPIEKWWYYCTEHGQHISFYTRKSLEIIAQMHDVKFYSLYGLHIFSKKKINMKKLNFIFKVYNWKKNLLVKSKMQSKTWEDHLYLRNEMSE